jgi:hypothetical protein
VAGTSETFFFLSKKSSGAGGVSCARPDPPKMFAAFVAALVAAGCSPTECEDTARWFRYAYRATGVPRGMCEVDHRVRRVALVRGQCADDPASQWAVSCFSCRARPTRPSAARSSAPAPPS